MLPRNASIVYVSLVLWLVLVLVLWLVLGLALVLVVVVVEWLRQVLWLAL